MLEENNFNAENTGSEQTGAQSMADIHPQTETEEQADTATYAAAEPQADEQAKIGQEAYEPPAAPVPEWSYWHPCRSRHPEQPTRWSDYAASSPPW